MHLRAKRGKSTIFVRCTTSDSIALIKSKLASILSVNAVDIAILLENVESAVSATSIQPGVADTETVQGLGLVQDQMIYFILRNPDTDVWEKLHIEEPKL
jgi:hypothetical protein